MIFAGLDIGTTKAKATLYDGESIVYQVSDTYPCLRNDITQEIDPEAIFTSVLKIIADISSHYPEISYLGVVSFGETFVILDENDHPLFPSLLYSDLRGTQQVDLIKEKVGDDKIESITGQKINPMYSLAKILYFKQKDPETFSKCHRILLIEDYIVYKLTKVAQIDYSLACRSQMFNIHTLEWSEEILTPLGLKKEWLSTPVKTGTKAGEISKELQEKYSFPPIQIINIAHDQVANAIGGGLLEENSAIDGNGTCECLTPLFTSTSNKEVLIEKGYGIIPYLLDNTYVCYGLINTGGAMFDWFKKTFYSDKTPKDLFSNLNERIENKFSKVLVPPFFAGAGTPYMNNKAQGGILNLNLGTTKEDIYLGILQSLCYELKLQIETIKQANIHINKIYATGGGSNNSSWLQLKANITNLPIYQLDNNEAGTIGALIIIGVTSKMFSSYQEACKKLVKVKEIYYPQEYLQDKYRLQYEDYLKFSTHLISD